MPIFISYSHQDSEFVDRLALQLVQHKVNVWMDRWELHVGDSLLTKVQRAITGASALLVIFSQASVASEWVKKEVNAGLLMELEEKKVIVLPVLVEDCPIPVFLRDKLYAVFRSDFDAGLKQILESVANISNASTGRIDAPMYDTDWAVDWGTVDARAFLKITLVERAEDQPLSVLGIVEILADRAATKAFAEAISRGGEEEAQRQVIVRVVKVVNDPVDLVVLLEDHHEQRRQYRADGEWGVYDVQISARRLGADTGRNLLYRAGEQLRGVVKHMSDVATRPNDGS